MYNSISRKILAIILLVPIFLACVRSLPATGMSSMSLEYPAFHKGMSYVTWQRESFATPSSDESMRLMSEAGVTCVSIVVTVYQERYNSTSIEQTDRTPSDASVRHVIRRARQLGMRVMLKPQVDLIYDDGNTRGDIGFNSEAGWKEWFGSYSRMISHYARMARDENVEFFCVGTELAFASTRKDFWRDLIIPDVRAIFHGQITYAANWDEYNAVEFWDILDYVGIDAYFPLSGKDNPTMEELIEGWKKWTGQIEEFQKKVNKPIVFTESGYPSADSAARKPWEAANTGVPNLELQANCYKSLLQTFWNKPWFFGVYWWNWNTYPGSGGMNNKHYTPQSKPALEYIKSWYCQEALGEKLAFAESQKRTGDAELAARLTAESLKPGRIPGQTYTFTGEPAMTRTDPRKVRDPLAQ